MDQPGEVARLLLTRSAFLALEREWDALAAKASPKLHFHRLREAVEQLPEQQHLRVVTVWRAGHLVAAAALVEEPGDAPRLELLGHRYREAREVLAEDEPALSHLLAALARLHRTSRLVHLAVRASARQGPARHAPDGLRRLQRRYQAELRAHP